MSNLTLAAAWDAVTKGAVKFATDQIDTKAFHSLVVTYATARADEARVVAPKSAPASSGGPTMPFGRSKGRPIATAPVDDVEWMLGVVTQSIDDPSKARFRDSNIKLAAALENRLNEGRAGDTPEKPDNTKASSSEPEDIPF